MEKVVRGWRARARPSIEEEETTKGTKGGIIEPLMDTNGHEWTRIIEII